VQDGCNILAPIDSLVRTLQPGNPFHKRRRGQRQLKESQARYPIRAQFNFHSLEVTLRVYDLHQQHPEMKLWEIAQELRFTTTLNADEVGKRGRESAEAIKKRATMGVAVARKLKIAHKMIAAVGRGEFPAF